MSAAPDSPRRAPAAARFGHRGPGGHHGPRAFAPGEKPKDFKGTVRKLLGVLASYKLALAVVFLFAVGSTVFNVVGPKVLSLATTELFDGMAAKIDGTGGVDFGFIGAVLTASLGLYLLASVCSLVQSWMLNTIAQKTSYRLRRDIAEKVNRMPLGYFERTSTGDVLSRITNDVDTVSANLGQGVTQLVTSAVTIVGVIAMMLSVNAVMTLIALLTLPLSAVLVMAIVKRSQPYFVQQQAMLGAANGLVEETFSGHAVVRAFNREDEAREEFSQVNGKLYESAWKSQFASGLMMPAMTFVGNLGYVAVALSGSLLAVRGVVTVGDIQAFIQYVKNLSQPVAQLAQVSNVLQSMAAAAERVFAFLDEPEVAAEEPAARMNEVAPGVEFDHVRFGYDLGKPVIEDFCATVLPGQTVALVGPTGAGKTTIVKLLMRFCDVQDGSIRFGGVDSRDFARQDVRDAFGMVLQDAWLFNGTIRENIRYGRLDATDEEVEQAAKAAFIHRFITTLPEGYDTVITEDASNVSAGQRQLITIARAVLADRRMLILDEATSSVDTRTEERIQRAMDNLMADRTSFVIAHRLSTIKAADLILVMRDGDVVEQGTHDELLALGGFYAQLYNAQFAEDAEGLSGDAD